MTLKKYTDQNKRKNELRPGEFIYFSDGEKSCINSGVVRAVSYFPVGFRYVVIDDVNGDGESMQIGLPNLVLYNIKEE